MNDNRYSNDNINSDDSSESDNSSYSEKYYNGNQYSETGYTANPTPYSIYPTPRVKDRKRKGQGLKKALLLTASAVAFGIIAGTVFQGYNYIAQPRQEYGNVTDAIPTGGIANDTDTNDGIVPVNRTADGIITDVSDVVANVIPSIVAINSSGTAIGYDFFGRQIEQPVSGSGSGIIIGQTETELSIVTNNHVVEGTETVEIVFADDTTAEAVVKGSDSYADLAILTVELDDLSEETISNIKIATLGNSDNMMMGEMVIAIGNALGYGQSSITVGYVSALDREIDVEGVNMTLLQTDAAINPGNSGGALINIQGEVIGINSVKFASAEVEGMGYAIPITDAIPIINELLSQKAIERAAQGFLGVDLETAINITESYSQSYKMPEGIYINDVVEDSPAAKAGLQKGNIITGFNSRTIKTIDDFIEAMSHTSAGDNITLKIMALENGKYIEKTLNITLGERP